MNTKMTGTPDTQPHDSLTYKQTLSCLSMVIRQALTQQHLLIDDYRVNQVANAIGFVYDVTPHLEFTHILHHWLTPTPTISATFYDSKSRVIAVTKDLNILVGNVVEGDVYLDYLSPYYAGWKLRFNMDTEILLFKVFQ